MEVSDSLQALPFELNPDQYSALVEEFHNCAADFLKDLPYAKVTATEEEIGSFLNDADARRDPPEFGRPVHDLLGILRRAAGVDLQIEVRCRLLILK